MARREKVEYVLVWKWMETIEDGASWTQDREQAFDAESAINGFHKRMRTEHADYSKTHVMIREVVPSS